MKQRKTAYGYPTVSGLMAYNLLEYLTQGGTDERVMRRLASDDLKFIREREDCADFRVAFYVRILYEFDEVIPDDLYDDIKDALLNFPYDDCGGHGMCTWTENHRLYNDGSEYLMGVKFREDVFGDGKNGLRHMLNGCLKLNEWISHVKLYGFCEWESNNYYPETIAALSNILQLTTDEELRADAADIMDRILCDILSQTVCNGGYMFSPACARAYVDNKISAKDGNYLDKYIRMLLGEEILDLKEKEACFALLLRAKRPDGTPVYVPSPDRVGRELLLQPDRETVTTQGVDIKDYKEMGLASYAFDNVKYALMSGAISDYRVIENSMMYFCETGLIDNTMLKPLKPFAKPILYRTGLLSFIKRFVQVPWDGSAMESGTVYTYTDLKYSVSVACDYRVGKPLFQQNSLSVALSHDISLFTNAPSKPSDKTGSPDYWIGSAVAPLAAACKNVALEIYDTRRIKKTGTHLFFPTGLFDELDLEHLDAGVLMGRTSGVNVAVFTNPGVHFRPIAESMEHDASLCQDRKVARETYDREYDLINISEGYHYYVFEADRSLTFEDFRAQMLKNGVALAKNTLTYRNAAHTYELTYQTSGSQLHVEG